jgi:hypothetical protein
LTKTFFPRKTQLWRYDEINKKWRFFLGWNETPSHKVMIWIDEELYLMEFLRYNIESYQFPISKALVEKWSQLPWIFSGHWKFPFLSNVWLWLWWSISFLEVVIIENNFLFIKIFLYMLQFPWEDPHHGPFVGGHCS